MSLAANNDGLWVVHNDILDFIIFITTIYVWN
jgi:hypothetical protein